MERRRILCVDDSEDSRDLLQFWLQSVGYQVSTADGAATALAKARAQTYDLFILDSRMPDEDGFGLCRTLCAEHPQAVVVFYSGAVAKEDERNALAAGAAVYLRKPDDFENIEKTIGSLLGS